MRLICLDIGEKRTGLAVGDDETGIITPLPAISAPVAPPLFDAISKAIDEHGPERLVVGLPINMDGTHGPMARRIAGVAQQVADRCGLPVDLHDERLSSFSADQVMARSGLTHEQKKKRRDSLAAAAILKDFLDSTRTMHDGATTGTDQPDSTG